MEVYEIEEKGESLEPIDFEPIQIEQNEIKYTLNIKANDENNITLSINDISQFPSANYLSSINFKEIKNSNKKDNIKNEKKEIEKNQINENIINEIKIDDELVDKIYDEIENAYGISDYLEEDIIKDKIIELKYDREKITEWIEHYLENYEKK